MKFKIFSILLIGWSFFSAYILGKQYLELTQNRKKDKILNQWRYDLEYHVISETPFLQRFKSCDDELLLEAYNSSRFPWQKNAIPAEPDSILLKEFEPLYHSWPAWLKSFCENHIDGVHFVSKWHSSATAIPINNHLFAIVVNNDVLDLKPNEWLTKKEQTLLVKEIRYKLEVILEKEEYNTPSRTLENILIHEIGHCFGAYYQIAPMYNYETIDASTPFISDLFETRKIYRNRKSSVKFPELNYYENPIITIDKYMTFLKNLENSGFPTTYSTKNEVEYFAEMFYSYMHCIIQRKPYYYNIYKNNMLIFQKKNGIFEECNKSKVEFLDSLTFKLNKQVDL